MASQRYFLNTPLIRDNAINAIRNAGEGFMVVISEPKRSGQQNARLWAMLGDVARSKPEGRQWTQEVWKCAFMHSLGHQVMFAEGLDGSGPFPLGFRSSNLSVKQMADLITVVAEYGDRHGVEWREVINGGFMEGR